MGFPEEYRDTYKLLYEMDRLDNRQLRVVYANDLAASTEPGEPYPYGSVLVLETHGTAQDALGNAQRDEKGRFVTAGSPPFLFVMRKEQGFGADYGSIRNGDWEYAAYRADKTPLFPPERTTGCANCHLYAQSKDFVHRAGLGFQQGEARGTGAFWLEGNTLRYHLTVAGLSGPITGAHFHSAAPGEEGAVVQPISFSGHTASGSWAVPPALLEELKAGKIYVNVHTAAIPGGELRGQVIPASALGGMEVAFSRSAARSRLNYAWKGITDDRGEVEIDITEEGRRRQGAGGYYKVRLSNPLTKRVIGEWHSIPVQGGRTITLRIPVGGVPALAHPVFGVPLQPAARPVAAAPESRIPAVALFQNYPNPFNTATQIRYDLPQAGPVRLSVYDLLGQEVARLVDEPQTAGSYTVTWDAGNMASGLYYYLLDTEVSRAVKKLVLIK